MKKFDEPLFFVYNSNETSIFTTFLLSHLFVLQIIKIYYNNNNNYYQVTYIFLYSQRIMKQ